MMKQGVFCFSLGVFVFFFQAEDGIRDVAVTGVQTCALPIFGKSLKKIPEAEITKLLGDYGLAKFEDLYAAVGFGKYSARQVLTRLLGEPAKSAEQETVDAQPTLVKAVKRILGFGEAPLVVKGHDDLLVYRAKCCNPIPGDEIVGYITRGRAVAVHTRTCPNVQNLMYQA